MNFPSDIYPSDIQISTYAPSRQAISHSGKRYSQTSNIQRWGFKLEYALLQRAEHGRLFAAVLSAKGKHEVFAYTPPIYSNTFGDITGTATAVIARGAGSAVVLFSGATGKLSVGDYIKFSNHDKVYMVTRSDTDTVTIEPPLYKAIDASTVIIYNRVSFLVSIDSDSADFSARNGGLSSMSISLMEVVS